MHVLLSKADKLTRQEQSEVLSTVRTALARLGEQYTVQLFSSLKRTGIAEAETVLGRWLGMEIPPEAPPIPQAGKPARPKNRKAIGWSARSSAKKA